MKRLLLPIVLIILTSPVSIAQVLRGKITNESGEAIPYATVYIQELRQGTTTNTKGDYEIRLPAGRYLVTYQSLGFSPVFFNLDLKDQPVTKDAVLPVQLYQIPEVRISASGEDPAYGIMRKAIGMAPYYLNNVSYYKAEVYLKGNLYIKKIPKLLQRAINVEARKDEGAGVSSGKMKEGDVYLMESFNEIEFTAPDEYVQKVISINSTFPDEGESVSPMDFIQASFYEPLIANMAISPLSPQAFSHYKFRYQGATLQGNNVIDKIQVIPKIKSQQLFEGVIYIIEDLWCLYSIDLTNDNIAGKITIQQVYIPVQDDIWLPVSHKFSIDVAIIGVRADAGYGSSVKYLEVRPNTTLKRPESLAAYSQAKLVPDEPPSEKAVSKSQLKIDKILEKKELNNRDMVALSRLMNKEAEKALPDSVRNNLEIKENTTRTVEKDANKKDSAFWAGIRPIPLSDPEIRSIMSRDSIKNELVVRQSKGDTISGSSKKVKSRFARGFNSIISGHTWSDSTGFSFTYGGLVDLKKFSFNTVDGFIYGQDFRISKYWKNIAGITIVPEIKWAFNRERLMWRVNGTLNSRWTKYSQLFFRTGVTSKDISTGGSVNPLLNSVTSLFFKRNYPKLYESRYFTFGFRRQIKLGINLEISAGLEDRIVLQNTTNFAFSKSSREYTVNKPDNTYLGPLANPIDSLRDQRHFEFVTNVTFTPRQKYRYNNKIKVPAGSDWPTFTLTWKHGINEFAEMTDRYKHYDMIMFEATKKHELGGFSEFRWRVRSGGYLNNKWITFYDFFHFNSQSLPVLLDDYFDATRLADYYSLSTPEFFGEVHIKYTTPYLILKFLPGLSKTLMRENLSLSYLGSRFHTSYTEVGYSISEIFLIGELGLYAGFENVKFSGAGAKVILKFN
jgi:hypothetical protein